MHITHVELAHSACSCFWSLSTAAFVSALYIQNIADRKLRAEITNWKEQEIVSWCTESFIWAMFMKYWWTIMKIIFGKSNQIINILFNVIFIIIAIVIIIIIIAVVVVVNHHHHHHHFHFHLCLNPLSVLWRETAAFCLKEHNAFPHTPLKAELTGHCSTDHSVSAQISWSKDKLRKEAVSDTTLTGQEWFVFSQTTFRDCFKGNLGETP